MVDCAKVSILTAKTCDKIDQNVNFPIKNIKKLALNLIFNV